MTSLNVHWVESVEVDEPWAHPEMTCSVTGAPLPTTWSNVIRAYLKSGDSIEICLFSHGAPLGIEVKK